VGWCVSGRCPRRQDIARGETRRLQTYRSSPPASQYIHYRRNSGSRPEPIRSPLIVEGIVYEMGAKFAKDCFTLRIPNKIRSGTRILRSATASAALATGRNSRQPPLTWVYCSSTRRSRLEAIRWLQENRWLRSVEESHRVLPQSAEPSEVPLLSLPSFQK